MESKMNHQIGGVPKEEVLYRIHILQFVDDFLSCHCSVDANDKDSAHPADKILCFLSHNCFKTLLQFAPRSSIFCN